MLIHGLFGCICHKLLGPVIIRLKLFLSNMLWRHSEKGRRPQNRKGGGEPLQTGRLFGLDKQFWEDMTITLQHLEACWVESDFRTAPTEGTALTIFLQVLKAMNEFTEACFGLCSSIQLNDWSYNGCLPIWGKGAFWTGLDSIPKTRFHIRLKAGQKQDWVPNLRNKLGGWRGG